MIITPYEPDMEISAGMVISGMPNEVYHTHESISKSGLDLIARSPAHFHYAAAKQPTRAMEIGTAIHAALLEPERFQREYVLLRDVKDRRASEYKQAVSVHGSERVLVSHEADEVAGMQEAVYSNQTAKNWLEKSGRRELSVFAQDPETGALVRCRFDILTDCGFSIDIKKTQDAREEAFSRAIDNYRYHVQAAFYSDVFLWATGEKLAGFKFIAVEQEMPHGCKTYRLDETAIIEGRRLYREDLNLYAECLKKQDWPCYEDEESLISLPEWRIRQIENEMEIL